jgi:Zn-dependent peptidase ImmA (M78 family)
MIVINGERWRVRIVSPSHPILVYKTGNLALGCCDDITKTIYLSQSLSKHKMRQVLCHELVHAAMYSYNVDLEDNIEEIVANIIAEYGDEIIRLTNTFDKLK